MVLIVRRVKADWEELDEIWNCVLVLSFEDVCAYAFEESVLFSLVLE